MKTHRRMGKDIFKVGTFFGANFRVVHFLGCNFFLKLTTEELKNFQCRFCEMPFSVASTLEKHMRKCVAGGKKPGLPPPHWAAGDEDGGSAVVDYHDGWR